MHRHVIALRDDSTLLVEECARVIAPFLDVRRVCGSLEGRAHLLCQRGEKVPINFEADRI
jgi:hypothetical protein